MDTEKALALIKELFQGKTENQFKVGMAGADYITAQGNSETCYILCSDGMIIKVGDTLRIFNEEEIITEDVSIRLINKE